MVTTTKQDEQQSAFQGCDRFLMGHGPRFVRQLLMETAEDAAPDEKADQYGSGGPVDGFEREIADLLGKEAAVFLPTGTMTQQIALRIWSERRGVGSVGFHPTCHLEIHEQKAYQRLHGLHARLIGSRDELITLDDLNAVNEPLAALLLELPQREIGGLLPSWNDLQAQTAWARERDIALHMDGARLWESGPFYDRPYAEIAGLFDSVYVSFYKGLGSIGGAALAGSEDFIAEARVWAKRHGGGLFGFFPYVVSARLCLRRRLPRFPEYHRRARAVAAVLGSIPGISIRPDPPQTTMMHVFLRGDADRLMEASVRIAREERIQLFRYLRPTGVPGVASFELTIGDAAESISDDEIRASFTRIMEETNTLSKA